MSGSLKKIIWLIAMAEFLIVHFALIGWLYIHEKRIILGILVVGFIGMAVYRYLSYRFFIKDCVSTIELPEDENVNILFREALSESESLLKTNTVSKKADGSKQVRLYQSLGATGPFVMGFLSPSIILPDSCKTHAELKTILLHECIHIKRHDTQYKLFMLISNCFLWYNPLAYMIRYISYQDIEISCDETLLKGRTKEERIAYGQFLIDNVRNMKTDGSAFNTYWDSGSKRILKNRIDAILNENRKWDLFAKTAIVFLAAEACFSCVFLAGRIWTDYRKANAPVNEYENSVSPDIYNEAAIKSMMEVDPFFQHKYGPEQINENDMAYPQKNMGQIDAQVSSPWQIKSGRPAMYGTVAEVSLQRLYFYLENQTAYSSKMYEEEPFIRSYEVLYSKKLAGDINNSVWGIIWKVYCPDLNTSNGYKKGYAFTLDGEENYLYYETAVQIKMTEPYLFETVGYANLRRTMEAYKEEYGTKYNAAFPELASYVEQEKQDLSEQQKSADEFADALGYWDVSISFPENATEGYMLANTDKAMHQVACALYKTTDGGKRWREVGMNDVGRYHAVVYDFTFFNRLEGYMAIHMFTGNPPELLRTTDGGRTWEKVAFSQTTEDFCQATIPIREGEKYIVYVGKEGSSIGKGEKARYESTDAGQNWKYTGQVILE